MPGGRLYAGPCGFALEPRLGEPLIESSGTPLGRRAEDASLSWGLGVGVWGLGFGVWGLGLGAWGLGFGVWGLGFGVWGFGSRV